MSATAMHGDSLGVASLTLTADPVPLNTMLASAEKRTEMSMSRMEALSGQRLAKVGQNMSRLGSQWTRSVSLPIVGAGAGMVKVASDFEGALTQVQTQAGASGREISRMREEILKLAPAVGQTPTNLANGLYHIESAGIRGAKAMDLLTQSAKLAAIGHTDLEQTTSALVSVMKSAPKDVKSASDAIGIMNAVVGSGNMRMGDLVGALSTGVVPAAKSAGLGLRDVGAALDVMTSRGVPATDAATRLRMTISLLSAPTGAAAKALKSVGIGQSQLANDLRKPDGLVVAVGDLKKHMDAAGLSATQQNALIAKAFGGGRSSSAILTLLQNTKDLQKSFDQIGTHSGAAQVSKAWDTTTHDMGFKLAQLKAKAETELVDIGTKIGPEVLKVAGQIADDATAIAHAFSSLPKGAQDAILTGAMGAAALGPVLRLSGVLTTATGRLWDAAQIAKGLATGNRSLFNVPKTTGGLAGGGAATMEVGTLVVRNMVGAGAGSGSSKWGLSGTPTSSSKSLGTSAVASEESAAGGGFLSAAGGVASRLLGAAGVAAFAAPIAFATYEALNKLFASPSYGTTIAGHIFSRGFGGAQAPSYAKQAASALDQLHQMTTVRNQTYGAGFSRFSGARTTPLVTHISVAQLSPQQMDKAMELANKAGKLVAKSLEAGWNQYRFQSEPVMLTQLRAKMKELPPAAQASAALSAVKFAEGLEKQGRLPKGSAQKMLRQIEQEFPQFEQYLALSGRTSINEFNKAFDLNKAQVNVKNQLHRISQDFPQVQDAVSKTAGTIQDKSAAAIKALKKIQSDGTGPMRRQATKDIAELRAGTTKDMTAMAALVDSKTKAMTKSIKNGTGNAASVAATNFANFANTVAGAMSAGTLATSKGMQLIAEALNAELVAFGQKPLPKPVLKSMSAKDLIGLSNFYAKGAAGGQSSAIGHRAARGAVVQFGRPGDAGPDNIPVNMGGQDIVVGSGEVGAVLTRHQFAGLNSLLAGTGGLPGYLARFNRPNYMATGGLIPGYATGGLTGMLSEANKINARHYPYVWGGGHNSSFTGPYDCSGAVSAVLHAGGDLAAPEVSGELMHYGLPGPGAVTIYANPVHAFMSIDGRFFGTHGSSGAGWYQGSALPGFVQRHAPVGAGGSIKTPKVQGSGAIASIVRAGLKKAAAAGNSKLQKVIATMTAGGGPGGGDWGTFGASGPKEAELARALHDVGFNKTATAGILGNVAQESEFGAASPNLFQFTPPIPGSSGSVAEQVALMMSHGGSGLLGALNRAGSPADAASMFMNMFERPLASAANLPHRIAAANAAFSAGYSRGGLVRGFRKGGLFHHRTKAHIQKPWSRTGSHKTPGPRSKTPAKSHKPAKAKKLPKLKPLPGFDTSLINQINQLDQYISGDLSTVQSYLQGLHGASPVVPVVTLADGTDVVNWDGMVDPSTGQWAKGINERLAEIGDPGASPNRTATRDLSTELGVDEQILDAYLKEQSLAGVAFGHFGPWLKRMQKDQAKRQDRVNDLTAVINRVTDLKARLPQQRKDQEYALNRRFQIARHRLQSAGAGASFNASEILAEQIRGLDAEKTAALAGVPTHAPAGWTGTKKGWADQRRREHTQLTSDFAARRAALEDTARKHNFAGRVARSNALFGLGLEEGAEKHRLSDLFSSRSLKFSEQLRGDRASLTLAKHFLTSDNTALSSALGSGGVQETLKAYLDPMGTLSVSNIKTMENITIPALLNEIASLKGTTPQTATSSSTSTPSELVTLLQQQLLQGQNNYSVSQAQYGVLSKLGDLPPFGGSFLYGGRVPGAIGEPRTIIAHGGEVVQPVGADVNSTVKVIMEDHRTRAFVDGVEQKVDGMAGRARRSLPGAAGGGLVRAGR